MSIESSVARVQDAAPQRARLGPGRPRADQPTGEVLRELVIAGAERVYSRRGYRDSSVEQICVEAGVSRSLFYRMFRDRREIIEIVVHRAYDELVRVILDRAAMENSVLTMASAATHAYLDWCVTRGSLAGPLGAERHDRESPVRVRRRQAIEELIERVDMLADRLVRPRLDPLYYETLIGAVEQLVSTAFWPQRLGDDEIARRRTLAQRLVLASLAGGADLGQVPSLETITVRP
jgi:AcrR family transcriptional regulator